MIIALMATLRKARVSSARATHPFRPRLLTFGLVAMTLLGLSSMQPAAASASGKVKQKTADLARIKAEIAKASRSLSAARGKRSRLSTRLQQAEQKLSRGRAELASINRQLKVQEHRAAKARRAHARAAQALQAQQKILANQLRAVYLLGDQSRLKVLLSAQNPALIGRLLGYYGYLRRAQTARVEQVQQQVRQVAALQRKASQARDHLKALQTTRRHTVETLRGDKKTRARALSALDAKIAGRSKHLKYLRASEQQITTLLDSLKSALTPTPYVAGNHKPFGKLKGELPWPLHGKVLEHFGAPKAHGRLRWKGVWIAAPEGAPVRASARGRVVYVGWISSYGLIVLLQHGSGYFTLYGHNATAAVTVGMNVEAGQQIATAGDTGGYRRSGVYLEIRHGNHALNPGQWLRHGSAD